MSKEGGFPCSETKTAGRKKILEMITMTTEEIKRLQDFDQNETTASAEKRKQIRETTKSWKEVAILQKTGMKYS